MKPNFALTLSFEGIGLLHRSFPGWQRVGEVTLENTALAEELAKLRETAVALEPSGMFSKLVIPNEQIRYLTFEDSARGADATAQAVRESLEGATPYAVEDLSYDWSVGGGYVYVAAVARETLDEAEDFAAEHRFAPCCFVAIPEAGSFVGEPFFGKTRHAAEILPAGEDVERETAPIRIIAPASHGETGTPADSSQAEPPATTVPDEAGQEVGDEPELQGGGPGPAQTGANAEPADAPAVAFSSIRASRQSGPAPTQPLTAESRISVLPGRKPSGPRPGNGASASGSAGKGKWGRRTKPEAAQKPARTPSANQETGTIGTSSGGAVPAPGVSTAETEKPAAAVRLLRRAGQAFSGLGAALGSGNGRKARAAKKPTGPGGDTRATASAQAARSGGKGFGASFTSNRGSRRALAAGTTKASEEAQRMTVFGARGRTEDKSRFIGLVLSALLLLALAGVAAWASIFMDEGLSRFLPGGQDETELADVPSAGSDAETIEVPPVVAVEEPAAPDLPTEDAAAEDPPVQENAEDMAALPGPDAQDGPDPAIDDAVRDALTGGGDGQQSPDGAAARYAATGIWQLAPQTPRPPASAGLDAFYKTSIDRDLRAQDGVARPELALMLPDEPPPIPIAPPPPGTRPEPPEPPELVEATEDGALSPEGVRIFAGPPPVTPPEFPERPEFVAGAVSGEEIETLASLRPRTRPGEIGPETAEEGAEAPDDPPFDLRPRIRPDDIEDSAAANEAESVPDGNDTEADAPDSETDTAIEDRDGAVANPDLGPFNDVEPQAVAVSLTPRPRPEGFRETVSRLRAADEDRLEAAAEQALAPDIPSSATVAKQATERNVLNLRKVNLIGIYGAAEDRRALVRLSSGRYRKVQVGDRLDGGQVAAISEEELRYVKGGRSVILRMPRG
ncbi:hypothetical protein DQW77_06960 [Roseovarius sp. TE539]|uniref:hypothetical protein n=1 Tax=Roseovarius sp. TE539 TaxID=2249812 RepID=UPI000DDDA8F6|nr:hypothetical protein [Roseovarius sp. TE539]RBI74668.1 hypothetical protein DQW77_06960 [Roseovarius sp. TE539]